MSKQEKKKCNVRETPDSNVFDSRTPYYFYGVTFVKKYFLSIARHKLLRRATIARQKIKF